MSVMRTYVGTSPTVTDFIRDQDGDLVSLTGSTCTFRSRPDDSALPVVDGAGTPDPDQVGNKGKVTIGLGSPIMDAKANYTTWWHVLFPGGKTLETDANGLVVSDHDPVVGDGTTGPCSAWISSDDIAALPSAPANVDFSDYAVLASQLLYMWSGRQFPGDCLRTVRPSRLGCSDWLTAWYRPSFVTWDLWSGRWWRRDGSYALQDGCAPLSRVLLPGYVREIASVTLNGLIVDPSWYRLDFNRELVALYDDNGNAFSWPACQDMRLGATDPGAFNVSYRWGHPTPEAGRKAAARFALELYKNDNGGNCSLPTSVVRLVRQGVTLEKDTSKPDKTGLMSVDAFLAAYNPTRKRRAPAVWSPDTTRTPRRTQ